MDSLYIKNIEIVKSVLLIAVPYLLLGALFGKLFSEAGGASLGSTLMAIFTFAGTSQFVALEYLKSDYIILFVIIFVINVRHIAYVLDCRKEIGDNGVASIYLCLTMTDENYSLLKIFKQKKIIPSTKQLCLMFFCTHCFWIVGCYLGTLIASDITLKGVDFILISLFGIILTNSLLDLR